VLHRFGVAKDLRKLTDGDDDETDDDDDDVARNQQISTIWKCNCVHPCPIGDVATHDQPGCIRIHR